MLNRTPLELDEKAFKKLNKLLAKTHEQALAIAAESAARRNDGRRRVRRPSSRVLHFKRDRLTARAPPTGGALRRFSGLLGGDRLGDRLAGGALTLMTTFGAFFRRLDDWSFIVTLPLPDLVVVFLEPAIRMVPVSFALAAAVVGGIAVIVQTIVLPSADRSQVTRTLGVSPLSPLSPFAAGGAGRARGAGRAGGTGGARGAGGAGGARGAGRTGRTGGTGRRRRGRRGPACRRRSPSREPTWPWPAIARVGRVARPRSGT